MTDKKKTATILVALLPLAILLATHACTKPEKDGFNFVGTNDEQLMVTNLTQHDMVLVVSTCDSGRHFSLQLNGETFLRQDSSLRWVSTGRYGYWKVDSRLYLFAAEAGCESAETIRLHAEQTAEGQPLGGDHYHGVWLYNPADTTSISLGVPHLSEWVRCASAYEEASFTYRAAYTLEITDDLASLMQRDTSLLHLLPEHYD